MSARSPRAAAAAGCALAATLALALAAEAAASGATAVRVAQASSAAAQAQAPAAVVEGAGIRLDFDARMRSRVEASVDGGGWQALGAYAESESLQLASGAPLRFRLDSQRAEPVEDALGHGRTTVLAGSAGSITKELRITAYDERPGWLLLRGRYTNTGGKALAVAGYTSQHYLFDRAGAARNGHEPDFWSYQPASYEKRPDWLLPVGPGYGRGNFLGMNATDYGGGTPVLDVWRRDVGIAIGHVELVPKLAALPVRRKGDGPAEIALRVQRRQSLAPGESFETLRSFVSVHHGDHFATLRAYAAIMQAQGLVVPAAPADAFEPIWCAWGYGQSFTPQQVFDSLPVVSRLGFRWAVLDDGWQAALGDWTPMPSKFPAGDADMKALVDRIHAAGLKAQLWWSPLNAKPTSLLARSHPDWLLRNADGSAHLISYWNADYLCPAYGPVRDDAVAFVRKALGEWGFDGLKIDGQHLNAAPACSNPAHHHARPEDSFEQTPAFFRAIWEAAQSVHPGAVVEICPCGTGYSYFTMPYLNMAVASDPESSWQVRLKGKTLKALLGDRTAYFGDHVEMSEGGDDFASTFGIGGVIGTNFAWRDAPGKLDPKVVLTPRREREWARWTALYRDKRLVDGEYLGTLYDIGYDRPEAHVVRKGDAMYYAFYAPSFAGTVELRGLAPGRHRVYDYVNGRELGIVSAPGARVEVKFTRALLVEVRPVAGS